MLVDRPCAANNKKCHAMTDPESPQTYFILNSVIQPLLGLAEERGFPLEVMAKQLGLDAGQMADPNGWLPLSVLEQLLHQVLGFVDDPLLGLHFSQAASPASFGTLGYLTQACATLTEAFEATTRYERLISDFGTTSLRPVPGGVLCCWACASGDALFHRHALEYLLGSWMVRFIQLVALPRSGVVGAVYFQHAPPKNEALLQDYAAIFRCPVYFNQEFSGLLIPASIMSLPLRHPNPELREVLERHARLLLSEVKRKPSVIDLVRSRLRQLLVQGHASRDLVAEQLGMSGRHLHRQLQKAGSSYRDIVDELRFEMAKAALRDPTLLLDDIARQLGFQETSAFTRWFRTASGQAPGEYRKQMGKGEEGGPTSPV